MTDDLGRGAFLHDFSFVHEHHPAGNLPGKPYFMSDVSLEKAFSLRWADFTVKGVVNNLFNEEYESVLSRPMPRLNVSFFIGITPKFGKR